MLESYEESINFKTSLLECTYFDTDMYTIMIIYDTYKHKAVQRKNKKLPV